MLGIDGEALTARAAGERLAAVAHTPVFLADKASPMARRPYRSSAPNRAAPAWRSGQRDAGRGLTGRAGPGEVGKPK